MNDHMTEHDIVLFVNGGHVTYKPNTKLTASARVGIVDVRLDMRVTNSVHGNRGLEKSNLGAVFQVTPGTRDSVLAQLLHGLVVAEAHEVREFLQVDGWSPFHPHSVEGTRRYRRDLSSLSLAVQDPNDPHNMFVAGAAENESWLEGHPLSRFFR